MQNLSYINKQISPKNYQIKCLMYFDQYYLNQNDRTIEVNYLEKLFEEILDISLAKEMYTEYIQTDIMADTSLAKEKSKEKKVQKQIQKEMAYIRKSSSPCKLTPYLIPREEITYLSIAK